MALIGTVWNPRDAGPGLPGESDRLGSQFQVHDNGCWIRVFLTHGGMVGQSHVFDAAELEAAIALLKAGRRVLQMHRRNGARTDVAR